MESLMVKFLKPGLNTPNHSRVVQHRREGRVLQCNVLARMFQINFTTKNKQWLFVEVRAILGLTDF